MSDLQILELATLLPGNSVSSTELGEYLDMSQQGVYARLVELEEDGLLDSKKTGGTRLFWPSFQGQKFVARRKIDGYEDS